MLNLKGLLCVALISVFVGLGSAADCCSSYNNPITGEHVDGKFCSEYCCIQLPPNMYDCCDDSSKQAPAMFRDDDCNDWLNEHWIPIVGGVVLFFVLVTVFVCCYCRRRRMSSGVIIRGASSPNVVVVSNQTQMVVSPAQSQTQNPVHYGYDQN